MTPGRAVMVELMACYLRALLDPFVTLLEGQKLMYFTQIAGEPLKWIARTLGMSERSSFLDDNSRSPLRCCREKAGSRI